MPAVVQNFRNLSDMSRTYKTYSALRVCVTERTVYIEDDSCVHIRLI